MNATTMILGSLTLATALAVLSMLLLRRSLFQILIELCGNEARARFWQGMASLAIVLMTLFGVLLTLPPKDPELWSNAPGLREVLGGFRTGVFGLLVSLGILSFVLLLSINGAARRQSPDPSWMRTGPEPTPS